MRLGPKTTKAALPGDVEINFNTLRISFPVNFICFSAFFSNFQFQTSVWNSVREAAHHARFIPYDKPFI